MPPTVPLINFSTDDLGFLSERGSALATVESHLAHYEHPPVPSRLLRPCTLSDGIVAIDDEEASRLIECWEHAHPDLDIAKFVPASGAASRMFGSLLALLSGGIETCADLAQLKDGGDAKAADCLEVVDRIGDLALRDDLSRSLVERGKSLENASAREILETILGEDGLGYAALPKGLLAFHRHGAAVHTPVHEHLFEACTYAMGRGRVSRLQFTVSPEHRSRFEALVAATVPDFQQRFGVRLEVSFSTQHPSSDSLAVTPTGEPFRDDQGHLLFRPAGHGALIENLGDIDADIVFVKNIDNVLPASAANQAMDWKKVLGGLLHEIRTEVFAALEGLHARRGTAVDRALEVVASRFGAVPTHDVDVAAWVTSRLDRPLRVCGMVRNEGEPGGGPFWVTDRLGDGAAVQIVESSQIDLADETQKSIFQGATHFNPVDLVCAFRKPDGSSYELDRFVDSEAVFIAEKTHGGRALRSLELPGLWNGAMAAWNTVFVEVPPVTFNPVKTLSDLLRPAHRAD
ncbi:MAG: hypothetical protein ACI8TX_000012 [Hyphomicrobiaceae bacterium]